VFACVHAQRPRNTSAGPVRATKSAKVKAKDKDKVKVKVESPDEVTCSTDDVQRQSTAAEVATFDSADDTASALPDTTTENISDVIEVSASQLVSNGIVEEMAESSHSAATRQQLGVVAAYSHTVHRPTSSIVPYTTHQHQYHNIHHTAPQYYRHDQRFPADDIDDILSVMASVAGVTAPHAYNYN